MRKRLLALILALLTIFALPTAAFASPRSVDEPQTAATLPTEEEVYERLMAMQELYPEGSHWDSSSYYIDRNGWKEGGCFGFAIMLQEAAFPDNTMLVRKNAPISIRDVHAGDILSYGITGNSGGHSVIVVEVREDCVVVAEGNVGNGVSWDRTMSAAEVSGVQYRWTYYNSYESMKNGWYEEDGAWYYYEYNWRVTNAWRESGGQRYYLDSDGKMAVDWGKVNGQWYYFNDEHDGTYGCVLKDRWLDDGGDRYYLGSDGVMAVGWRQLDGKWYYFNSKRNGTGGRMLENEWLNDGGKWYYLGLDGEMAMGLYWVTEGGSEGLYYFNEKHDGSCGRMLSGWQDVAGSRYYFETRHNGLFGQGYVDGTYTIGGGRYDFDTDGRMIGYSGT